MTTIKQAARELREQAQSDLAAAQEAARELDGELRVARERIAELERQLDDSKADTYTESQYSSQQVRANVALLTKVDRLERVQGVLVGALRDMCRNFPTDTEMAEAGWVGDEIESACTAYDKARAALAAVKQAQQPEGGRQVSVKQEHRYARFVIQQGREQTDRIREIEAAAMVRVPRKPVAPPTSERPPP